MNTNDLLEKAKKYNGIDSDYGLQEILDAQRQEISKWKNGKTFPGPYHCAKIAEATGHTLEEVMAAVQYEKEKDNERKKFWRDHMGTAASTLFFSALPLLAVSQQYILC